MVPADLKYTEDHQWVRVEGRKALIGITEYAQGRLGDVVFVDLPAVGEKVKKQGQLGRIESINSESEIYAPVSGEVLEINEELQYNPELINQDPFNKGWVAVIEVDKPAELKTLLKAEDYQRLIGVE